MKDVIIMNNSDLSLDFLKKCQKCRENGVPNDMAILAALQDLADWKDQHPREGLWDAEMACDWIQANASRYWYDDPEDFIQDLRKAMED